ncbi:Receptor-like serine/threonine-protein kinase [Heracleum sosnowskyi]|uniref:Receptor-like serine/threonine-protein kinase n=1 Tax=Heracleum sosnowskyi TaxID=360622 RepID=A0AAD8HZA8_9APIA|nr:Receptor-like serine/threonine-protein kinase [Heracleum sosnowskyi]
MQGEVMKDDGQIITSENQDFAFGFFSPGNSAFRYVGVWYNNIQDKTVVWVANRNNPISGKSGLLSFGDDGNLRLTNGNNSNITWSTNYTSSVSRNSSVTLRDTGNLALCRSEDIDNNNKALWQSFSHPTDTFLPEMRVYTMSQTQNLIKLVSWKSPSDPSEGNYSMAFDPRGSPQIVVWEGLNHRIWRSGHWNGLIFIGVPNSRARFASGFGTTTDSRNGDTYFSYTAANRSQLVRFNILSSGKTDQLIWDDSKQVWNVALSQPTDECGNYNRCGDFGLCNIKDAEKCSCITGFGPKSEDEWRRGNWSGGCIRKKALKCDQNDTTSDGFLQVEGVKLPDFADILVSETNLDGCEDKCTNNCSCSAYAYVVGIGCMVYGGELIDIEHLEGGNTLYVRVSNSELGGKKSVSSAAIIAIAVVGTIIIGIILWAFWRFREKIKVSWKKQGTSLLTATGRSQELSAEFLGVDELSAEGKQGTGPHLPLFSFTFVELATDYFAIQNKLGQGGFGPVYKGILPGGQEVAVKRLSKRSGQGLEEFKTEVILIAKLQHRNLVRLLGCCIEGEEKLLVYEYMPNKSLDSFLFDARQRSQLNWSRRIFGGNQIEANTIRVVGTYGYMSPEYAMEGLFSVKSDVYSFGVLLLEIVSGQRNNTFRSPDCTNLIRYAWNLWKDGKTEEMIDPVIADSRKIVLQCIHVGMLCVQMSAAHRPTMSQVLNMLESESTSLPLPRVPDMSSMNSVEMESAMRDHDINLSSTEVTVTEVFGR